MKLSKRKAAIISTVIVAALLLLFGRGLADRMFLALVRIRERVISSESPPLFERDFHAVVRANTAQADELENYLLQLRHAPVEKHADPADFDFSSEVSYENSCDKLRSLLATRVSYPPPNLVEHPTAKLRRLGTDRLAGYYEVKVPVLQGVNAGGTLMLPRNPRGRMPLVVAALGRGGMPEQPRNGKLSMVRQTTRDLAFGALEKGYAIWEPIFVFYGKDKPADLRERLEMRARESGTSLIGIEIAKVVAGIDALSALPQIDRNRVAMVGMSYGGFYTLYTAALDRQIKVAVVSAYFNDREAVLDSTEPFGFLDWRFSTSLSIFRDPTVVALICPRPIQIQSGTYDQLFGIEGSRRTIRLARQPYQRLNIATRFSFVEFLGRHDFNGPAAWTFLERFL